LELSGKVHALPLYPQEKSPSYPFNRRLEGPQSRYGHGNENISQPIPGLEPLIIQPIAQRYTAELFWLLDIIVYEHSNRV
jgi:hypothetical protein